MHDIPISVRFFHFVTVLSQGSGKGKGGTSGKGVKGGPGIDEPDVDIDRRVGSNDAGQWTRKPEEENRKEENNSENGTAVINNTSISTVIADDIQLPYAYAYDSVFRFHFLDYYIYRQYVRTIFQRYPSPYVRRDESDDA